MNSKFLEVAVLGKTIGLRGALKLHNRSDFPDQFKKGALFLDKFGNTLKIKSYNSQNCSVIFEGFEDIDLARTLVNQTIFRTIEETKKSCCLNKDEYLYCEIIGNSIYEDNLFLGEVIDILETGKVYLFCVKAAQNLVQTGMSKEFYIPYLDNFIISVDLSTKSIYVKNSLEILKNS